MGLGLGVGVRVRVIGLPPSRMKSATKRSKLCSGPCVRNVLPSRHAARSSATSSMPGKG